MVTAYPKPKLSYRIRTRQVILPPRWVHVYVSTGCSRKNARLLTRFLNRVPVDRAARCKVTVDDAGKLNAWL